MWLNLASCFAIVTCNQQVQIGAHATVHAFAMLMHTSCLLSQQVAQTAYMHVAGTAPMFECCVKQGKRAAHMLDMHGTKHG